ncbi:MAG: hypothetical protein EP328_10025 [Gammaproteobacteria bacterium]|nr:MAG: hypothetical protein EP328_10025 [Gammaproteobacteria bacterium]
MRVDSALRFTSIARLLTVILMVSALSACKTEKAPDQPTILGVPPSTAYLGVEYYYNFGAYGGEDILDYSLTNAPSWLALEDTSNKAREGIIMRGVPGLTGGNRGDADLGKIQDINLVTTDSRMAGLQPFDIEVKYNPLSLEADTFTEGSTAELEEGYRNHCTLPDLESSGEHEFTINKYASDGSVTGTKQLTVETHPVVVKVVLDQPSVTRVAVAFDLTSEYDATDCDNGFTAPHQRCDYSEANAGDAAVGQDLVALGSNSDLLLEQLDYLTYELDNNGNYTKGVVTFEPGITECYIRLEVVDDSFPEPSEAARLTLTEVRSGLAGLGESNSGVRSSLVIDDDEPVVVLETAAGGTRDALNVGDYREYVARIEGERTWEYRAKLGHSEDSTARLGTEFVIETYQNNSWAESDEVVFPASENEVPFRIRVDSAGYSNPSLDDRFILLTLNEGYQAGREYYARAADNSILRVNLNELVAPLALNAGDGFVATDVDIAHSGRIFVSGYDQLNNDQVLVKIFDQKGALLQNIPVSDPAVALNTPETVLATLKRKVPSGSTKVDRYEFAVAYSTDQPLTGTNENGGQDVVVHRFWYDTAVNGGEYVEDWVFRTGTAADDIVRSLALAGENGYVLVAGETNGSWPEQVPAGGFDSFLQRIDAPLDGNSYVPELAWTRQVGSAADDSVAGVSALSLTPILFGSAQGSVGGAPVIGGVDAYFYSATAGAGDISVNQVGSAGDEAVSDGLFEQSGLWLLGNGAGEYSVQETGEESRQLVHTPINTSAGFLLGYSSTGDINRAFTLNDPSDSAEEAFEAVMVFSGDLVAAGKSDGDFEGGAAGSAQGQGIATRISLLEPAGEEDTAFRNEWRAQLPVGDTEITALANYRDDEITMLARQAGQWLVLVYSPEGELLTPLN